MNNGVNVLDCILQTSRLLKVVNLDKIKTVRILWSGLDHKLALGHGTGSTSDLEATGEELVDNMSTNEPCRSRYENILSKTTEEEGDSQYCYSLTVRVKRDVSKTYTYIV